VPLRSTWDSSLQVMLPSMSSHTTGLSRTTLRLVTPYLTRILTLVFPRMCTQP